MLAIERGGTHICTKFRPNTLLVWILNFCNRKLVYRLRWSMMLDVRCGDAKLGRWLWVMGVIAELPTNCDQGHTS